MASLFLLCLGLLLFPISHSKRDFGWAGRTLAVDLYFASFAFAVGTVGIAGTAVNTAASTAGTADTDECPSPATRTPRIGRTAAAAAH